MTRHTFLLTIACIIVVGGAVAIAADLQERTRIAYDEYAERATKSFVERARDGTPDADSHKPLPRTGGIVARPAREDGILSVPGGLVHNWTGSTFIAGVTLQDGLDVSYAYNDYHSIYQPVVASRLLGRDGSTYRVLLRLKGAGGGLSATLDVTSRVQYFYPDDRRAYSISTSEEIREIKHPGAPDESRLPVGHDSGYLWRAATFTNLVATDDGLFVEMETLGLSRGFPPLLGWIIEPIARRLGRQSVERSLLDFSQAVRARAQVRRTRTFSALTRMTDHEMAFARTDKPPAAANATFNLRRLDCGWTVQSPRDDARLGVRSSRGLRRRNASGNVEDSRVVCGHNGCRTDRVRTIAIHPSGRHTAPVTAEPRRCRDGPLPLLRT